VRDEIIGNDVDRAVRNHGRSGGRGDYQCEERARDGGHWRLDSAPWAPAPRQIAGAPRRDDVGWFL
jgi:hypothetical protein